LRVLFDTSCLVAALLGQHEFHARVAPWVKQVHEGQVQGVVGTHTLAECYAVITRHPQFAVPPQVARMMLKRVTQQFSSVSLDEDDYLAVVARLEQLGLVGGSIYDALIAQAALKVQTDVLLTFNGKHFVRLGADVAGITQEPA
jgi:predicted nucleic acid-binding protein